MQRLIVSECVLLLASTIVAQAPTQPADRPFVRLTEKGDDGRLDVMVATYRRGDVTVTLVGSVHIADRSHYTTLQQRFATFDALLYEMDR